MTRRIAPLYASIRFGDSTRGYDSAKILSVGRRFKYLERPYCPVCLDEIIGLPVGEYDQVDVLTPRGDYLGAQVSIQDYPFDE